MELLPTYLSLRISMDDWQDETILIKHKEADTSPENQYEAKKLRSPMSQAPYLASIDENNHNLSINSIRLTGAGQIIPLRLEVGVSGTYVLEVNGLTEFAQGACVTLEDVFTNTTYILNESEPIELPLEANDRTERYQLRMTGSALSTVTNAGCAVNAGGSAEVSVQSGSNVYVEWLNQDGSMLARTTPVNGIANVQSLRPGYYAARIVNNGACASTEVGFEVVEMNKLGATAIALPATCENTNDGGLLVNISGGREPYTINWENGANGQTIENAVAGKYKARIIDADGCSNDFEFEIHTVSKLLSKFDVSHESIELQNGKAPVNFTNGSENADRYDWSFGDGSENSTEENPTHAYISAGVYEVMLKATHENCESVSTRTIAVAENSRNEEFASNVLATLTDRGVQVTFLFDELENIRINAYNVLGQQLIEPIYGQYGNQTILFGDRRYAANALIEVTNVNTGEKTLVRLGN
jgi:PKD repeat protein